MFLIILWCWWNPTWAQIICQTCFDCFLFCVGSSNAPDSPVSALKMSQTLQTWFLLILSCIFVEIHKTLKYFRFNILRPQLLFWMDFQFLVAIWDQLDLTGLKTKHYLWKVCPQVWTMGSFYCTKQWRLQSIKHFIEQSEVLKTWNSMPCDYTGSQGFHTNVSLNHSLQNETFMDATDRRKSHYFRTVLYKPPHMHIVEHMYIKLHLTLLVSTEGLYPFTFLSFIMVDLFLNRVLIENNWDQDELNTEHEITGILENRIVMLFFASAECEKCLEFVPVLNDFFKRLKDPAYIEYPKLLALIYIRFPHLFLIYISVLYICSYINISIWSVLRFQDFSLSSLDQSEEKQENFLKELHKKVLFLAFEDPYRKWVFKYMCIYLSCLSVHQVWRTTSLFVQN